MTTSTSAASRDAQAFLAQWGFSGEASSLLKTHATLCSQYCEYRVSDIVIALELATA